MESQLRESGVQSRSNNKLLTTLIVVILFLALVFAGVVALISQNNSQNTTKSIAEKCASAGGMWLESTQECESVEKSFCDENNGTFDECASACRNNPDSELCTLQCVQVCSFDSNNDNQNIANVAQEYGVTIMNEGESERYTQVAYENETAFDLLNKLRMSDQLDFTYVTYDFGVSIDSFNGVKADSTKEFWEFFVNGQSSSVGVSDYLLKPGDELKFELTQF